MIDKTIYFCEELAKTLGVTLKISHPVKSLRRVSVATNSVAGVSLIIAGVAVSSKILVTLGALGLAGAVAVAADMER